LFVLLEAPLFTFCLFIEFSIDVFFFISAGLYINVIIELSIQWPVHSKQQKGKNPLAQRTMDRIPLFGISN
jgi:hypothetical protein